MRNPLTRLVTRKLSPTQTVWAGIQCIDLIPLIESDRLWERATEPDTQDRFARDWKVLGSDMRNVLRRLDPNGKP